jgi:hypothetical protein
MLLLTPVDVLVCVAIDCCFNCCEQLCWPILHPDAAAEGGAEGRVAMAVAELYREEGPFEPQVITDMINNLNFCLKLHLIPVQSRCRLDVQLLLLLQLQ